MCVVIVLYEYLSNHMLFGNSALRVAAAVAIFFGLNAALYLFKQVILVYKKLNK